MQIKTRSFLSFLCLFVAIPNLKYLHDQKRNLPLRLGGGTGAV